MSGRYPCQTCKCSTKKLGFLSFLRSNCEGLGEQGRSEALGDEDKDGESKVGPRAVSGKPEERNEVSGKSAAGNKRSKKQGGGKKVARDALGEQPVASIALKDAHPEVNLSVAQVRVREWLPARLLFV